MPWRRRRHAARKTAAQATGHREAAEAELAATERKRAEEEVTVVAPLRRMKNEMLKNNHVTEEVVRLIRGGR
jgi:hypothetical protein